VGARDGSAGVWTFLRLIASLIGIPGVSVHVRGDTECTVTYPADQPAIAEQVAGALRPFRTWQVPEADRQRSAAMGFNASPVHRP
jgi:hypothetical protein